MPVPFKVKALYEYKSDETDDLSFGTGQVITVTEEEDDDWYTGEYTNASGQRLEGIFPRNFVEKYEPAIPTRPTRPSRKSMIVEPVEDAPPQAKAEPASAAQPNPQPPAEAPTVSEPAGSEVPVQRRPSNASSIKAETKPTGPKQPPAVAGKPTSSAFKDRIAAFNKAAAAPIAPFKPPGGAGSSGFIKKPFVAPPPSRNAYVPPPSQAPAPHIAYRRDEDPNMQEDDDEDNQPIDKPAQATEADVEPQAKPTSLKDRIALLQQQQLEQAQRLAEKRKSKKPPTKRSESTETIESATAETTVAPIARRDTGDTLGRNSIEVSRIDEEDSQDALESSKTEPVVSTPIPPPSRELVSDTNDADDSDAADTEDVRDISDDEEPNKNKELQSPTQATQAAQGVTSELVDEQGHEETEDEDPEIRRRRELRDRMAKMSGGMGMMGMFGPPGGMPAPARKSKPAKDTDRDASYEQQDDLARAPPVPVMALPGMGIQRQPEPDSDEDGNDETAAPTPMESRRKASTDDYVNLPVRSSTDQDPLPSHPGRSVPSIPRAAPSIPKEPQSSISRAVPPLPPARPVGDDSASDGDDEPAAAPPIPSRTSLDRRSSTKSSAAPMSVPPIPPARPSIDEKFPDTSTATTSDKRASRAPPPPVPSVRPVSPTSRAPPPPPPAQPPSRGLTSGSLGLATSELPGEENDEEVTEYEGDYDTDIASSAKHKAALKSHNRDSSIEDDALTDDAKLQASPPPRAVPPPPPGAPPRDAAPPAPVPETKSKRSSEVPRTAPPPVPTTRPDEDDYDPYRYSTSQQISTKPPTSPPLPPGRTSTQGTEDSDLYGPPAPPRASRAPPPPPPSGSLPPVPTERVAPLPPPPAEQSKSIADAPPPRLSTSRRSVEIPRASADYGFIATDVDLAESSGWWTQENSIPPSLQGRNDILYEVESNTTSKRGGKTTVTRDIYVLYMDYSQSSINVSFDPSDPNHASFQQSHERPPPPPRQDQLESASENFGVKVANAAQSTLGNAVADGSAHSLILELLQPFQATALMPVGTRSYGALVYANLANASTQQFDEIRAGDIVTFRNAKFAGHRGGLHAKYSMDVGKPDHVAFVIDWDGTKKKIRAWEQGREEKGKKTKVREESFRIGDLKSGEVRVWRIMPRSWVNWDKS